MADKTWDGTERRQGDRRARARWGRRLFVAWLVVFSLLVMYSIRANRDNTNESNALVRENSRRIAEIKQSKAAVSALQRTNCGLLKFLVTARKARWQSYEASHRSDDLRAVMGYEKLAEPFVTDRHATGKCPIPKRILIATRPLITRGR